MERIYVNVHTCISVLFDIDILPPIILNFGTAPTTFDVQQVMQPQEKPAYLGTVLTDMLIQEGCISHMTFSRHCHFLSLQVSIYTIYIQYFQIWHKNMAKRYMYTQITGSRFRTLNHNPLTVTFVFSFCFSNFFFSLLLCKIRQT